MTAATTTTTTTTTTMMMMGKNAYILPTNLAALYTPKFVITVKTIKTLSLEHNDKFYQKSKKVSRRASRSPVNEEFGNFERCCFAEDGKERYQEL